MSSTANRSVLLFTLLGLFASAGSAVADPDQERTPREWLDRMNRAFLEASYDGVFSYYSGDDLSTLRVVHTVTNGVQRERLVHMNGAPREIVRTGDAVECILQPGDEMLALESSIPTGPFARAFTTAFEGLSDNYTLSLHGTDRVANRQAVRLAVMPRDSQRYGFRLWIDRETGLLLRSELVDLKGVKLEIFEFATIKVGGPISEQDLAPEFGAGALKTQLSLESTQRESAPGQRRVNWEAHWVPDGFTMASWDIRRMPSSAKSVDTLMYSDGLAMFSVFIEDLPDTGGTTLVSRSGATVAVSEVVKGGPKDAHHLVTVVGEIPTATAQRIAQSIRYVSQ
jgi:sigma-E factor negative regulatory protein RseB